MKASGSTRLALVGVALVVLLGIVAVASRGHVTPAGTGAHSRAVSQTLFNIGFTLLLLGLAAGGVIFVVLNVRYRAMRGSEPFDWKRLATGLGVFGAALVLVLLATRFLHGHGHRRINQPTNAAQALAQAAKKQNARKAAKPTFEWELAAAIVALVAGIGLTALMRAYRRRNRRFDEFRLEQELQELLTEALDDLRGVADPRAAVIAAYARMEASLAAHGLARRPSEAPLEYLARVLLELEVSRESVEALTRLFQRAKFSPHEIDPTMKDEAIEALEALRADLAVINAPDAPQLRPSDVPEPSR